MSEERDPLLEALFAKAARERVNGDFSAKVMANVDKRRRNVIIGRIAIVALILAFEFVLSSPMQNSVGAMTAALGNSLVDIQTQWLAATVAPLNSVAGLIGMLLLGMHFIYRKLIR